MKYNLRMVFGVLFVFIGALIVLQNLNVFSGTTGNIIWAALFAGLSIFVFSLHSRSRNKWWLAAGMITLSITAGNLATGLTQDYGVLVTLIGSGIGFLLFFLLDRTHWWSLIPSGILISLGVNEFLQFASPNNDPNGIIFLGLGLAFVLLILIPTPQGRLNWAVLPAVILLAIGMLASFEQGNNVLNYAGPAMVLLAGGAVLVYSFNRN